jgi:hypothetical protein
MASRRLQAVFIFLSVVYVYSNGSSPKLGAELALTPFGTSNIVPLSLGGWTTSSESFRSQPFLQWGGTIATLPADSPAPIDGNGWPTADAYIIIALAESFSVDPERFLAAYGGNFSVSFRGSASLFFPPQMNATIFNSWFDNATYTTSLTLHIPQPPTGGIFGVIIGFGGTRRNASSPINSGITDLVVAKESQNTHISPLGINSFWNSVLLAAILPLHHLRTMQWTEGWQVCMYTRCRPELHAFRYIPS